METNKELPTAKQFFTTHWNLGTSIDEIMVRFAKHHREQMIEAIAFYGDTNNNGTVDMDSIINAYPENEIK